MFREISETSESFHTNWSTRFLHRDQESTSRKNVWIWRTNW